MAYFAELNSDNIVLRVVVIDNNDVNANGGDQSEQAAEYVKKIVPLIGGVKWIQTSFNSNFRRCFAGKGYRYSPEKDIFIANQPYPSWILDSNDIWQPPVPRPTDGSDGTEDQRYKDPSITSFTVEDKIIDLPNGYPCPIYWDTNVTEWACKDSQNILRKWNSINKSWDIV